MKPFMNPLVEQEYQPLVMKNEWLDGVEGLVRIQTDMDGSCFFHAIAKAYCLPYIEERFNDAPLNRRQFIRELRQDLSNKLCEKVNDSTGKTYYETISRGILPEIAGELPEYSCENMKKVLASNFPVDNIYNEFVSDVLEKDIYILDGIKQDVYATAEDLEFLYKDRPSIVLLYIPGHYELVGQLKKDKLYTLFEPEDKLVQAIRRRLRFYHKN